MSAAAQRPDLYRPGMGADTRRNHLLAAPHGGQMCQDPTRPHAIVHPQGRNHLQRPPHQQGKQHLQE